MSKYSQETYDLILKYFDEGKTQRKIAEILDIPHSTINNFLQRHERTRKRKGIPTRLKHLEMQVEILFNAIKEMRGKHDKEN